MFPWSGRTSFEIKELAIPIASGTTELIFWNANYMIGNTIPSVPRISSYCAFLHSIQNEIRTSSSDPCNYVGVTWQRGHWHFCLTTTHTLTILVLKYTNLPFWWPLPIATYQLVNSLQSNQFDITKSCKYIRSSFLE